MGNSDRIFKQSNDVLLLGKLGNKLLLIPSEMKCGKIKKGIANMQVIWAHVIWVAKLWVMT